jgi:hypothetical protein
MALTVAGAAAAALYLIGPLRGARRREGGDEHGLHALREEREAVYTAIADLEHDFETGKLDPADYAAMREEFRQQAIALMRAERARSEATTSDASPPSQPAEAAAPQAQGPAPAVAEATPPATGAFCPGCGGRVDPGWRFCSHCGGALHPPADVERAG